MMGGPWTTVLLRFSKIKPTIQILCNIEPETKVFYSISNRPPKSIYYGTTLEWNNYWDEVMREYRNGRLLHALPFFLRIL
jgi:hypothetical protein